VVGAGDLGRALVRYQGFAAKGIEIAMLYDIDPKIVGTHVNNILIRHVDSLDAEIRRQKIRIAILTVPAQAAQEIADMLVNAGVKAILNYAPVSLILPQGVHVQYIDPVLHLQRMMYYLGDD